MPYLSSVRFFLAAYTAVNQSVTERYRLVIFLAAYTAVNGQTYPNVRRPFFLAAYTAVNME
ncbi:hypothetical protein QOU43_30520, partial [Pseudomonas aeruginosa]